MNTIAAVTVGRSDFGIYRPVLRALLERGLLVVPVAGGSHLDKEAGYTIDEIREAGYPDIETVDMSVASDEPEGIAKSMSLGVAGFAAVFGRRKPDTVLLLGDRFEMFAAASAALPFAIPIAHIHGGELTEGAIDDQIRHAITKMSHLHFVSTDEHRRRVLQMGEEPWRVTVSGAPGLDNLQTIEYVDRATLAAELDLDLDIDPLLVTFHPVTLEYGDTQKQIKELINVLRQVPRPIVLTYPNSDTHHHKIVDAIKAFAAKQANVSAVPSLGVRRYFSLMKISAAMVGNSSSGIIEAASFGLPVVNIGSRQAGRIRGTNVIDVECSHEQIEAAIVRATSIEFRAVASNVVNPYGNGNASRIIAGVIADAPDAPILLRKKFCDLACPELGGYQ